MHIASRLAMIATSVVLPGALLLSSVAHALTPEVVQAVKRGTVLIRTDTAEGSGFFFDGGVIITNRHVVEGAGDTVRVVLDSGTREATTLVGVVVDRSAEQDLAILWVDGVEDRALELAPSASVYETLPVVAVGFPMGSIRSFGGATADPPVSLRPGAVTALHRSAAGDLVYIEHNANMQTGNSGGPLVDERGRVIGVNVAMMAADLSTKLAIPSDLLVAYVTTFADRISSEPSASVSAPQVRVIHTEIARPFEESSVRELVVGPSGDDYVLFTNGGVLLLRDEQEWVDIHAGTNNQDIAIDDVTGQLYAVESDSHLLYTWSADTGWTRLGPDRVQRVAASHGQVWAMQQDGAVKRWDGSLWTDLSISGTEDLVACDGVALLRAGTSLWIHDGEQLVNDGEAVIHDVKQVTCQRDHIYGLMVDGTIHDLMSGQVLDTNTDNTAIYATTSGLLATTTGGRLWFLDAANLAWAQVTSPEQAAPSVTQRLEGTWIPEIEGVPEETLSKLQFRFHGEHITGRVDELIKSGTYQVSGDASADLTLGIQWSDGTQGELRLRFIGTDVMLLLGEGDESLRFRRR